MIHVRATETLPNGRVRFTLEADAPGLLVIFGPSPDAHPASEQSPQVAVFVQQSSSWVERALYPSGREVMRELDRWNPRAQLALGFEQ